MTALLLFADPHVHQGSLGPWEILWRALLVLLLVFANGFFVAAEFGIVKVRGTQVKSELKKGGRKARVLDHLVKHLDAYLSATQLGITLASLALGWAGEPFVARLLHPLFLKIGLTDPRLTTLVSVGLAFTLISGLHIVLGELVPKSLAIRKPLEVSLWTAMPLRWFYALLFPFIYVLNKISDFLLDLIGIGHVSEEDMVHSQEELRLIIAASTEGEHLGGVQHEVMVNAMELKTRRTESIMIPRHKMVILDVDDSLDKVLRVANKHGYSRYPLTDKSMDEVLGLVHVKDVAHAMVTGQTPKNLKSLVRRCRFVSEYMPLDRLLMTLRAEKTHMAIVVDEYGGTVGLVTLEDVLEEIVGEIFDEFDQDEPEVIPLGSGNFSVPGQISLQDFHRAFGITLEEEDVQTLAGFIMARLERVPRQGDELVLDDCTLKVKSTRKRRVEKVQVKINGQIASGGHG